MTKNIFLTLLPLLISTNSLSADEAPGIALERKVLQARQNIQHGKLVLNVNVLVDKSPNASSEDRSRRYVIEFLGDNIRVEMEHDQITAISTPEWVIRTKAGSHKFSWHDWENVNASMKDDIFDPRLLGAYAFFVTALDNHTLATALLRTDQRNVTIENKNWNGLLVKHLSYHRMHPVRIEKWIAPEQDYAVLQIKVTGTLGYDILTTDYQQAPPGIWFPRRIRFRQFKKPDRLIYEEVATVESLDLQTPPDPSRFEMESLDPEPGDAVMRNHQQMVWDGQTLITQKEAWQREKSKENVIPAEEGSSFRWLLLMNSVVLALLALAVILRKRKRNQRA